MNIKRLSPWGRLAALLIVAAGLHWAFPVRLSAQQQRIVFPDRTITVGQALQQIEQQTEMLVSFNKSDFNLSRKVRLPHNNLTLADALEAILSRSRRSYSIRGNHILIIPDPTGSLAVDDPPQVRPAVEQEPAGPDADSAAAVQLPDLTRPPVDVDSLERALRERMVEYPALIPASPQLDVTGYYDKRDREGFTPGKPVYTRAMPKVAVRTNLLYAAGALAPNVGVEVGIAPRSTLMAGFAYNGWNTDGTGSDNEKLCHWIAQLDYRYWLCERFNGHFLGAHAYWGYYNIGGKKIPMVLEKGSDRYRYKGNVAGAGIDYGYQLMLGERWNAEFNAGVGFGVMKYDKYECPRCGNKLQSDVSRSFFAPTKLGISLVFIIR
ncbi:MAG: DUF3575 domain-containing protein [Alistipes sp.]|nr:DUF3575 domain-containing protein [Alistipes sp.]